MLRELDSLTVSESDIAQRTYNNVLKLGKAIVIKKCVMV